MTVLTREFTAEAKADSDGRNIEIDAYSGNEVNLGWGREVIELASLEIAPAVPILMEHDRSLRVGVSTEIECGDRLCIKGRTLNTDAAQEYRDLANDGFPWQASVGTSFKTFTRYSEGEKVEVNGRSFVGPITVLSDGVLREVSVCSVGADADTSARAFAAEAATEGGTKQEEQDVSESNAATIAELKAAFPGEAEFVLDQAEKGATVEAAKAEFSAVLAERLQAANERVASLTQERDDALAKIDDAEVDAVGHREASAPKGADDKPVFKDLAEQTEWEWKNALKDEDRREFAGDFKVYSAYRRAELAGTVRIAGARR